MVAVLHAQAMNHAAFACPLCMARYVRTGLLFSFVISSGLFAFLVLNMT